MDTTIEAEALDRADMERLQAGQDAALDRLMERHAAPVYRFLCRFTGNEADAQDLAQETFVRVFKARASFRLNQRFGTWLFSIAANLARNHHRWRSRHPNLPLEDASQEPELSLANRLPAPTPTPSEASLGRERAQAVRAALDRLPPELREAIVLCEWEERSIAEAAKILQATPKAVESRLYRARQALREKLQAWL